MLQAVKPEASFFGGKQYFKAFRTEQLRKTLFQQVRFML